MNVLKILCTHIAYRTFVSELFYREINVLHHRVCEEFLTSQGCNPLRLFPCWRVDLHLNKFADAHILYRGHVQTLECMVNRFALGIEDGFPQRDDDFCQIQAMPYTSMLVISASF